MRPDEPAPESIEELAERLGASAPDARDGLVAGSLRFALRTPDTARRLLLTWEAEQIAGDAFADPAGAPVLARRRVCLECGRYFRVAPHRGGWCDAACFARWSADLPPEPRRSE